MDQGSHDHPFAAYDADGTGERLRREAEAGDTDAALQLAYWAMRRGNAELTKWAWKVAHQDASFEQYLKRVQSVHGHKRKLVWWLRKNAHVEFSHEAIEIVRGRRPLPITAPVDSLPDPLELNALTILL